MQTIFFVELSSSEIWKLLERLVNYVVYKVKSRESRCHVCKDSLSHICCQSIDFYVLNLLEAELVVFSVKVSS